MRKNLIALCLICFTGIISSSFSSPSQASTQKNQLLFSWYTDGYNDGYNDAIAHRTYFYSGLRRLIPEWEMSNYTDGYNDGWAAGGGQ